MLFQATPQLPYVCFLKLSCSNLWIAKSPLSRFPWIQDHNEYITCLSHTGFSTSDCKGELSPGHGIVMKAAAECVQMLDLLILQALKPNNRKKVGALLSEGICFLKPIHFLIFNNLIIFNHLINSH